MRHAALPLTGHQLALKASLATALEALAPAAEKIGGAGKNECEP